MPDMQTATIEHFDAEIKKLEVAHTRSIHRLKEAEKLQARANKIVADANLDVDMVGARLDSVRAQRYVLLSAIRRSGPPRIVPQELIDRARKAGLIQAEIAERLGTTLARYKSILSGATMLPADFLCQLTQVIEAAEAGKEAVHAA